MIVNGFCREVFNELPMEFAVEAQSCSCGQPGRERRLMLQHREPSRHGRRQRDPRRRRPRGPRRRGARHHGTERLRARARWPTCWPATTATTVTGGRCSIDGDDLLALTPEERARRGRVPRLPVSGRDPRRRQHVLPAHRAQRGAAASAGSTSSTPWTSSRWPRSEMKLARHGPDASSAARSTTASPAARRSATRSSRWRCSSRRSPSSTRPTPASTSTRSAIVAERRQHAAQPRPGHAHHHPLPAAPRLHRPRPRPRHGRADASCGRATRTSRSSSSSTGTWAWRRTVRPLAPRRAPERCRESGGGGPSRRLRAPGNEAQWGAARSGSRGSGRRPFSGFRSVASRAPRMRLGSTHQSAPS